MGWMASMGDMERVMALQASDSQCDALFTVPIKLIDNLSGNQQSHATGPNQDGQLFQSIKVPTKAKEGKEDVRIDEELHYALPL
jgi:hypothetical protein